MLEVADLQVRHGAIRAVVAAMSPERVFWGSDLTRLKCPYQQCVDLFTEELEFLSTDDKEWIMGRSVMEWLSWEPAAGASTDMPVGLGASVPGDRHPGAPA